MKSILSQNHFRFNFLAAYLLLEATFNIKLTSCIPELEYLPEILVLFLSFADRVKGKKHVIHNLLGNDRVAFVPWVEVYVVSHPLSQSKSFSRGLLFEKFLNRVCQDLHFLANFNAVL
jgi:hypothetical protein